LGAEEGKRRRRPLESRNQSPQSKIGSGFLLFLLGGREENIVQDKPIAG
jgi:hypothetical protein